MIKLKAHLNSRGILIPKDTMISLLPDMESMMVENGVAEYPMTEKVLIEMPGEKETDKPKRGDKNESERANTKRHK